MTRCFAGSVRRVELAASNSAARQRSRDKESHGCLTPRSQLQGGVVYVSGNGNVSLTDSTVRDCSAVYVRRVELAAALQRRTAAGPEVKKATAISPRSFLATAGRRRRLGIFYWGRWASSRQYRLGVFQRCGLANRLKRDGLLSWPCAPRRASRLHCSGSRDVKGGCLTPLFPRNGSTAASSTRVKGSVRSR